MKIALIGNMNNNNFAMMRYFRDIGEDAHLFLYENDGKKSNAHFVPENDTWQIEKWTPYIHHTKLYNGYPALIGYPQKFILPPTKRQFQKHFSGFDRFIGSGTTPALFSRFGKKLDIFYPYGTGIEFAGSRPARNAIAQGPLLKKLIAKYVSCRQIKALQKNTKFCINAEMSLTKKTFDEIGVPFHKFAIPMVYNREPHNIGHLPAELNALLDSLQVMGPVVFSHAAQTWVHDKFFSMDEWERRSKHNQWLFSAFAKLIHTRPKLNACLICMEYGKDVPASKALCEELGISDKVIWLAKMPRKYIICLLSVCDIGVGEFICDDQAIWGGTGWEVLASGKPLLQSFRFKNGVFEEIFGYPPPPMLPSNSPEDILEHLIDMADHPERRGAIGVAALEWFNKHNGIGLAEKWLELLIKQP